METTEALFGVAARNLFEEALLSATCRFGFDDDVCEQAGQHRGSGGQRRRFNEGRVQLDKVEVCTGVAQVGPDGEGKPQQEKCGQGAGARYGQRKGFNGFFQWKLISLRRRTRGRKRWE